MTSACQEHFTKAFSTYFAQVFSSKAPLTALLPAECLSFQSGPGSTLWCFRIISFAKPTLSTLLHPFSLLTGWYIWAALPLSLSHIATLYYRMWTSYCSMPVLCRLLCDSTWGCFCAFCMFRNFLILLFDSCLLVNKRSTLENIIFLSSYTYWGRAETISRSQKVICHWFGNV